MATPDLEERTVPVWTADQVLAHLDTHTVLETMHASQWPRRNILALATARGLLHSPVTDMCRPREVEVPDPPVGRPRKDGLRPGSVITPVPADAHARAVGALCSHSRLLVWADEHGNTAAKHAAARVRAALAALREEDKKEAGRAAVRAEKERAAQARRDELARAEQVKAQARARATDLECQAARIRQEACGRVFDEAKWRAAKARQPAIKKGVNARAGEKLTYDAKVVRAWAKQAGVECPRMGRFLPAAVVQAYAAAHQDHEEASA